MADKTLDLRGLQCPLPILKVRKALAQMPVGATIEVLATDPGAPPDFSAYCEFSGNTLLESSEVGAVFRFLIRRGADRT